MAEFVKERAGKPVPLIALPRGRSSNSTEWAPKVVEIHLQIGAKPAGCLVCNRPIPPHTTRVAIVVRFPTAWLGSEEPAQNELTTQTNYMHPACMVKRIKPEVVRSGFDCYDCAALPPKADDGRWMEHPLRCFTVSKFAPARLCETCAKKPRWRMCCLCYVYFPQWMVSRVAGQPTRPPSVDMHPFDAEPDIENGTDVCEFCARRHRLVTEEEAAEKATEFERLRREILAEGVFAAGDD